MLIGSCIRHIHSLQSESTLHPMVMNSIADSKLVNDSASTISSASVATKSDDTPSRLPFICGDFKNITCPFVTNQDISVVEGKCKNPWMELACENNHTVFILNSSKKFYVKKIKQFDGEAIMRIIDPGIEEDNCSSIPQHILSYYDIDYLITGRPASLSIASEWKTVVFLKCSTPIDGDDDAARLYVDTSFCNNAPKDNTFSYVLVEPATISDIKESCDVVGMTYMGEMSKGSKNYSDIHKQMLKGFDIWWNGIRY